MDQKSRALQIMRACDLNDIIQWEGDVLTLHRRDGQLLTMNVSKCYFYSGREPDTMVTVSPKKEGAFSITHEGYPMQAKYGRIHTNPGQAQELAILLASISRPKFV